MDKTIISIRNFLFEHIDGAGQEHLVTVILLLGILAMAVLSYFVCKYFLYLLGIVIDKTPTKWDDDLIEHRFMRALSQLAPALMIYWLLPAFFRAHELDYVHWIKLLTSFYILWAVIHAVVIFVDNLYIAMSKRKQFRPYAVKGIFQMMKLLVIGLGIIGAISMLLGKQPGTILAAFGASAAVLMLVFKDTIMGFVASVQLTANKMLHRGDWVEVRKHGANGEVVDITLTTVKIRNWDNSVTTIPPYVLVSDSFQNYQPMRKSGGRRVDRSIYIDFSSVGFCDEECVGRLRSRGWLEAGDLASAEGEVNLTLFRRYLERYLERHPDVRHDMLTMVRQMAPTQSGLPLQLYFFTRHTAWRDFEHVQSDIFDHVYAAIGEFGLRIYQTPAGHDLERLRNNFVAETLTNNEITNPLDP